MELLIEKASKHGFFDNISPERLESFLFSTQPDFIYLSAMQQWFVDKYEIYVSADCFNSTSWGYTIYKLDDSTVKGAPILDSHADMEYMDMSEALSAGLLKAFDHI